MRQTRYFSASTSGAGIYAREVRAGRNNASAGFRFPSLAPKKDDPLWVVFFGLRDRLSTCNQSVNKEVKGQAVRTYPSLADAQRCDRFGMRQTRYFSKSSASQYSTASESDWQEIMLLQGSDSRAGQKTEVRGQRSEYDVADLDKACSCIISRRQAALMPLVMLTPSPSGAGGGGYGVITSPLRRRDKPSAARRTPFK